MEGQKRTAEDIGRYGSQLRSAQHAGHSWVGQCTSLSIFVPLRMSGLLPLALRSSQGSGEAYAGDYVV